MISEVTRRDILDYLLLPETPGLFGRLDVVEFLDRVFQVKSSKDRWDANKTMADEIWQHYVRNDDWTEHFLFTDYLSILSVDDQTFINFLAWVLHPVVRKSRLEAEEIVGGINAHLQYANVQMVEVGTLAGRPLYGNADGPPKETTNGGSMLNYRLVAVDLAAKAKDRHTYAQLSLLADAVFGFDKVEHPKDEFSSSKAQLIYDWVITLAETDLPEPTKRDKLIDFVKSLVGAEPVLGLAEASTLLPASKGAVDVPASMPSAGDEHPVLPPHQTKSDAVWVIHGRDEHARKAMFDFLRALHLKPTEWSHAIASSDAASPFIGEVIDTALNQAQAVVVLFTGDDNGCLRPGLHSPTDGPEERKLQPQPRPNVLFEAGMAYGRMPERTIIVELGRLRAISDLAGRHAVRMDNSPAKRNALAQRLRQAGCPVNMVGDDWLTTGDFSNT
ncbi:MAG: AbiJ-related protein [Armatimonadota bacterium]